MIEKAETVHAHTSPSRVKDHVDELAQEYRVLVETLCNISEVYLFEARLDDAIRLLNSDVLKVIKEELPPEDKVRIQVQLAKMMLHKSRLSNEGFDAALELLFEIEGIAKSLNDKGILADVVNLIGWGIMNREWSYRRPYDPALEYFERGLDLRRERGDERGIAESLFCVGLVYEFKKDVTSVDKDKALEYYQEAHRLAQQVGDKRTQSFTTRHFGWIYRHKGDLDKALAYFKESLALREEIGHKFYLSQAYYAVGLVYYEKNDLEKAWEYYQRSYDHAEKIGLRTHVCGSLLEMGNVKKAQGEAAMALGNYQKALKVAKSTAYEPGIKEATESIKKLSVEESE
jgi:tetratricopeptide (TPR) repeat protein